MTAPPDDSTADLQAVITALRAERDRALSEKATLAEELAARTGELTQRDSGHSDRLGHQAATETLKVENHELRAAQAAGLEVLQAMIASPGDTQPVFDLIARQAANLCEVPIAAVGLFDGTMVHLATQSGFDAAYADVFAKQFPRSPSPDFAMGRAILNRRVEQIEDTGADTRRGFSPPPGPGSALAVPLLRNGTPLGVIAVGRRARGSFSRNQITLLETFAEQAVIAISSAETYRALQARTSDLQESLEQQTATAEVLQVINASPGDLAPVFDAMLEKALRLCDATFGVFWQRDGESFYPAALHGVPKAFADHLMRNPVRPSPNSGVGRTARGEPFVHITDIADSDAYRSGDPQRRALVDLGGGRTALWVGLRGDGRVPGVFTIYRKEVRPFTDKQIALLQNFAAQAVIAMENARLITEQREALEQQTATAEVLQVINASPGNLVPVFDAILEKAVRLCESSFGILAAYDGECFHNVAERGAPPALADILRKPMRSTPGTSVHRIVHGEDVVHVPDIVDDEAYRAGNPARRALADLGGGRTQLVVALRKDETLLGLINVYRREVRPFTDKQIALLRNFAAQAVIAMENARLLTEQQEALEQQTATAEVLQVINASPGNLAPVFDAMLEKAIRLCGSSFGSLATYDGEAFHVVAMRGVPPALAEFFRAPILPVPGMTLYRTVHDEDVVHVADLTDDEIYRSGNPARRAIADLGGARTQLLVALRKDHTLLGAFNVFRQDVRPFSDKQIALLENFAAQAVIAMENARLLTEQQEALEQQTATAEVLGVINASPGNLAPVFEAILNKAHALCGAALGSLASYDGEVFSRLATHGYPPEYEALVRPPNKPLPHLQRLLDGARFVHDADLAVALPWNTDDPYRRAAVEIVGIRTALFVPLRKDGRLLGYISAQRREVRPFSEKEIALLENFAAQAVIAMENARLINEQREALEQQTATAEVLQVINASPGNLAPVFDAVLERALRLCGASFGTLATYDGEHLERVAFLGVPPAFIEYNQRNPLTKNAALVAQGIATGKPVQATDIMTDERLASSPSVRDALVELGGVRALLQVPLLKDGGVVGFIGVWRREPGVFPDRQVALVEGFAAQAVIAMENARLLTEQQEALEQQTATAEVLQVINASPGNLVPVFDAMLEKAMRLCEAQFGVLSTYDGERFRRVASHGMPVAETQGWPEGIVPDPGSALERVVNGDRVVHILDLVDTDAYRQGVASRLSLVATTGARSALWVGLRKDDALLGVFVIYRREVRAFSDKQIALVRNFADQAVIAIENTRLLTEQREALEQQTATAEVLQVINASPGNLTPVFDTILEKALRLCEAAFGSLVTYDGEYFQVVATRGLSAGLAKALRERGPLLPSKSIAYDQIVRGADIVHIPDIIALGAPFPSSPNIDQDGARTTLFVALRGDNALFGAFVIYRKEVRLFSDKQIALLKNFAAQAVIAMENARLLTEQREALEQQTATAEVLQVINASPGNLAPVYDAMLEKAMHLCGAVFGSLTAWDGKYANVLAMRGYPPALAQYMAARGPRATIPPVIAQLAKTRRPQQVADVVAGEGYRNGHPVSRAVADLGGARTILHVPLHKDEAMVGYISVYRQEVRAFTDKQIALLENFAAQAVIAMENARLLDEIRQRQEELRVTFENMGDGVAMFDETQHLVAWNRKFQDILDVPDDIIARRQTFSEYVRYLAERGEYDPEADPEEHVRRLIEQAGQPRTYERTRPDGRVIEVRHNPVAGGGFVLIYADITERKRSEAEIRAARDAAEEASRAIEAAYRELKTAQANLIQAEKMASLGQLTAGIAHEIKNPLNFVNNFAALSVDLLGELKEIAAPAFAALTEKQRAEVDEVSVMLTSNLEKITEHGKRADSIVKAMLEHSRGSSGERRMVDLNALIDEALNLAYHGARAQDQSFNITLERDFGAGIAPIEVNPQDMTRVFLNLFSNGFYATTRRARDGGDAGFVPTLEVTTRDAGEAVEIRVRDNGAGIPADIRDKLFQPFFTTKPTGEGTGLGLSITYDIVTQQHGGSIAVDSKVGEYSEFTIRLPRRP